MNSRHKAGNQNTGSTLCDQLARGALRWGDPALCLEGKPPAADITWRYTRYLTCLNRHQIDDIGAVNIIFAQRERHHPMRKALRAFRERSDRFDRQIKCSSSFFVEAPAGNLGALPRCWREGPARIMRAIGTALKLQNYAKPPSAI